MAGIVDSVVETLDGLPLWGILLGVWLIMTLEVSLFVGVFVPGDVVVLFAASTVTSPGRFAAIVVAVLAGSLTGEAVGFGIGHRYGDRLRRSRLGRWIGDERWDKTHRFLERRGGRALVGARFLAAAHAVVPLVAGTVKMPYRRFVLWCAVGGVLWSCLYVSIGTAAGASYRTWADDIGNATWVVFGVLVVAVLLYLVVHKIRGRGDDDGDDSGSEARTRGSRRPSSTDDEQLTHVSYLSLPATELLAPSLRTHPVPAAPPG